MNYTYIEVCIIVKNDGKLFRFMYVIVKKDNHCGWSINYCEL